MKEQFIRTAALTGDAGIQKLGLAHVAVAGLGGVGSYAAEALVRAGVGEITLIDGDVISESNINRQLYALHSTVGMPKTAVAEARIKDINPDIKVHVINEFITPGNVGDCFSSPLSYFIDAIDDTAAKTAVALACKENGVPLIASMGTGRRMDASDFTIADISKTSYCPLAKTMRKKYADAGVGGVTVLFAPSQPLKNHPDYESMPVPSSVSFVPPAAGLKIAGFVIKELLK